MHKEILECFVAFVRKNPGRFYFAVIPLLHCFDESRADYICADKKTGEWWKVRHTRLTGIPLSRVNVPKYVVSKNFNKRPSEIDWLSHDDLDFLILTIAKIYKERGEKKLVLDDLRNKRRRFGCREEDRLMKIYGRCK